MQDLKDMKVDDLKKLAKDRGIKGVDGMKKAELIAALEAPGDAPPAEETPKKGLLDKAKDVIDSVLHPSAPAASESSSENSAFANHPKFAKFKSSSQEQETAHNDE